MFLLIHNKLPVPERLHRIGFRNNSDCLVCPGTVSDVCHYFCSCQKTKVVWSWVRTKISQMCDIQQNSDFEILNLHFSKNGNEKKIAWMVASYVDFVWENSSNVRELSHEKLFGFLTFKYREIGPSVIGRIDCLC